MRRGGFHRGICGGGLDRRSGGGTLGAAGGFERDHQAQKQAGSDGHAGADRKADAGEHAARKSRGEFGLGEAVGLDDFNVAYSGQDLGGKGGLFADHGVAGVAECGESRGCWRKAGDSDGAAAFHAVDSAAGAFRTGAHFMPAVAAAKGELRISMTHGVLIGA